MIRFTDVTLTYGGAGTPALRGIDLSVEAGESVAVVGPSGSGKTSLLRLMNALLVPTSGRVTVDGLVTSDASSVWEVRRRVGLIFQNPDNQLVSTTVERELAFGMENLGLAPSDIRERVEETLVRFRLQDLRHRAPHRLSGGEKQRVAIAAVLAMRPSCLLLDEPTSLLDAAGRRDVWGMLEELRADSSRTVVHVTQFPDEIGLSSRVLVVFEGRVVFDSTPAELFELDEGLRRWCLRRPAAMDIARDLRHAGFAIPGGVSTLDALADALGQNGGGDR
ncbi:MAG: ATP-binding cassette domain-containing protein [Candidatus Eisenbacteria bacterium]